MRLPRDLSGDDLARALERSGYEITRQSGSHLRPTTLQGGEHNVTIPRHRSLRTGAIAGIPADVAAHHRLDRASLLQRLFF